MSQQEVDVVAKAGLSTWQQMVLQEWLTQHRKRYVEQEQRCDVFGNERGTALASGKIEAIDQLQGELYGRGGETPYDW